MNKYGIAYYDEYADIKTAVIYADSMQDAQTKAYTHPDVCEIEDVWAYEEN